MLNLATLRVAGHPWTVTWAFTPWGAKAAAPLGWAPLSSVFWIGGFAGAAPQGSVFRDHLSIMDGGIILGALLAAARAGRFSPSLRVPPLSLLAAVLGGLLMGEIDRSPYFTGWLVAQRRRFRACHAAILERLVGSLAAGSGEAFDHLEQWLELAPFDQRVHALLLEALARRGRIGEGEEHLAAAAKLFEAEGLDWTPIREAWRAARNGQTRGQLSGEAAPTSLRPQSGSGETGIPAAAPTAVLARPAVAILPFANLSGDAAQEYFADGISEDLITALSHWRWFPVISRNSTLAYKGRAVE